jgi:hypothetical protein
VAICWENPILRAQNIILAIIGLINLFKLSIKEMRSKGRLENKS